MKSKRPQRVMLSYSNSSSNSGGSSGNSNSGNGSSGGVDTHLIYLLPPQHASAAVVDFAALCLSPPLQGGLRGIEGRLEPLLLPSHGCDRTAHLLGVYEMRAAEQVKGYLDRVLEEVDDKSAQRLREAEAEVQHREGEFQSAYSSHLIASYRIFMAGALFTSSYPPSLLPPPFLRSSLLCPPNSHYLSPPFLRSSLPPLPSYYPTPHPQVLSDQCERRWRGRGGNRSCCLGTRRTWEWDKGTGGRGRAVRVRGAAGGCSTALATVI
ncbi:hypothetical protein B484DRAFT_253138 [Ochromonadaceae sp. CCMP2298]|nr:hypothetical protein B484DRAFT_253138 [Ochromonadaceae sp. CCMP2298]